MTTQTLKRSAIVMRFLQHLNRVRQSFKRGCRNQRPERRKQPLVLEGLEERTVPSTITWTNRGQNSDNFAAVFGTNANTARSVVDTAIREWTSVISNFNQDNGGNNINVNISMNTAAGSTGGSTNVNDTDSNGKPTSASITLGRTGDGTNAWFLDPNLFSSAFLGRPNNAFSASPQAGSPATGLGDLLEVVTHELGHAMGFSSNAQVNARCRDTGVGDTSSSDGTHGNYWAFTGTGGFTCLLTAFNTGPNGGSDQGGGEHFAAPGGPLPINFNNTTFFGADDLMTPFYSMSQRRIVSRNDAFVLRDAFGYTVNDPATALGTFYDELNPTNGNLLIRGRQDAASNDTITVTNTGTTLTVGVTLGTPVPGTFTAATMTHAFPLNSVSSITIQPGSGNTTINIESIEALIPVTINGGAGNDTINISPTAHDLSGILGSVITLNGGGGVNSLNLYDDNNTFGGDYTITDTSVSRTFSGTINYNNIQNLTLNTSTGTDHVQVQNLAPITAATVNAGGGGGGTHTIDVGDSTNRLRHQSTLIVDGGSGFTTLNVNDQGTQTAETYTIQSTQVTRTAGIGPIQYSNLANLVVNTGTTGETVNVQSTSVDTSLRNQARSTVNLGNTTNGVQDLQGALTITGPATSVTLSINDAADPSARSATLNTSGLSGLAPTTISFASSILAHLSINNGSGDDTLTVDFSAGNPIPLTSIFFTASGLSVSGGGGNDRLVLQGGNLFSSEGYTTTGSRAGSIGLAQEPLDVMVATIGFTNVATIEDTTQLHASSHPVLPPSLGFNATAGADTINIEDGTIEDGSASGSAATQIGGPALPTVSVANKGNVFVHGPDSNNTMTLNHPTRAAGLSQLTLSEGTGTNAINVTSTSVETTINAGSARDTITVGASLNWIGQLVSAGHNSFTASGTLNVHAGGGTLILDDSATQDVDEGFPDPGSGDSTTNLVYDPVRYTVNETEVDRSTHSTETTISAPPSGHPRYTYFTQQFSYSATIHYWNASHVEIDGGSVTAGTPFTVGSTAAGTALTINVGSSVANVDLSAGNLNSLAGVVTVNGSGAGTVVNLNDQSGPTTNTSILDASSFSRAHFGGVTYSDLGSLTINMAPGISLGNYQSTQNMYVLGTPAGMATTINAANGWHDITVGLPTDPRLNTTGLPGTPLDNIRGPLTVVGQAAQDVMNLYDWDSSTAVKTYDLNSTSIVATPASGTASAPIRWQGVLSVVALFGSWAADNYLLRGEQSSLAALVVDGGYQANTFQSLLPDRHTWAVYGNQTVTTFAPYGHAVIFGEVWNLTGGPNGGDTFALSRSYGEDGGLGGVLDGGGPGAWLDYSQNVNPVTVNLATGEATGIGGGIRNIQHVVGSRMADNTLTGNDLGNILIGGVANNTLVAGSGNSILIGGGGSDHLVASDGTPGFDILIGGSTDFDNPTSTNLSVLNAFFQAWQNTTAANYSNQVALLRDAGVSVGGTTYRLNNASVHASQSAVLEGATETQSALDWFFASVGAQLVDRKDPEVVTSIF
jgi:hypothetical protein